MTLSCRHRPTAARLCVHAAAWLAVAASGWPSAAWAQAGDRSGAGGIYSCVDDRGRRVTSDRPIPECKTREQKLLNRDGSVRRIVPPTLTAEERAEVEAAQLSAAQERVAQADAVRRDRNLRSRFPNEAAHRRSREAALDSVRMAMNASERRLAELAIERKPLMDEAEFYKGRLLPLKLKLQIESNDAAVEAQRASIATQEAELVRINRLFDVELDRLRKLWAGAVPGSLGPVPGVADAASAPAPATAAAPVPVTGPNGKPR